MHVRAISLYPHQSSILLYRCGPDVEGLVEREELLHCETWEVCMYHPNHLKEREDVYQMLPITNLHEAVSLVLTC